MENQNYYENIMRRSCTGSRVNYEGRTETVPKEKYMSAKRRYRINLKKALISGIIAGAILTSGVGYTVEHAIPAIHDAYQVSQVVGDNYDGFREQYVTPNTYRTQDANHYLFYEYGPIAEGLVEYGDKDFDMNLFYCLEVMDSKNVDEVLAYAVDEEHDYRYKVADADGVEHSRNFRHYLAVNNYYDPDIKVTDEVLLNDDEAYEDAIKNFKKTMKTRIGIEQDFKDQEDLYNAKQAELDEMMADHNMDGPKEKGVKK